MSSLAIKRAQPANPVIANTTNAQVFALSSNAAVPCTIPVPGKLILEGKRFTIRAEGNLYTAGNYTAKASLFSALTIPATPLTIGNWTCLMGAGTARAVNNAWSSWYIQADLQFDSLSGTLQGTFQQLINDLYDGAAALGNGGAALTGINGTNANVTQGGTVVPPADPVFYVGVALTFGTGGLNIGNLYNFELGF